MSGFSTSSYVSKSELALELLRLVIPGKHDPSLDDIEERGPKGGARIKKAPGAMHQHAGYITTVINRNSDKIRHGWRRHYRSNSLHTKKGVEAKPRSTVFYDDPRSPTLPDTPRVKKILWVLNTPKVEHTKFNELKKVYRKSGAQAALEYIDVLIMTDRLEGK